MFEQEQIRNKNDQLALAHGWFITCFYCLHRLKYKCVFSSTPLRWVSSSTTLVCNERSGARVLLWCSVFKRQPWQLHKGWELKQGSRCYFPGTERLSHIDQQWVCHKSVNLSPIRALKGANAPVSARERARPRACVWQRWSRWIYIKLDFKNPSEMFQWFTVSAGKQFKQGTTRQLGSSLGYPTVDFTSHWEGWPG